MKRHKAGAASRQRAEARAQAHEQAARSRQEAKKVTLQNVSSADIQKCSDVGEHGQPLPPVRQDTNWI